MALPEKDIALIRRFCFHTKEIRRIRAQFSNQKKKLNKAQRALQSQVKDILAGSPDTAVAVGPNSFLVMATCYTTRPITLEMVRSALEHVQGGLAASELAKTLNKLRSKPSQYAKTVKKLPRGTRTAVWDNDTMTVASKFLRVKGALTSIRKAERDALADSQRMLQSLEDPLLRYARKLTKPQRIYLNDGAGLTCAYFLKKRAKRTTAKLTKKHLANVLEHVTLDRNNENLAQEIFDALQLAQADLVKLTDTVVLHRGSLKGTM